MRWPFAALGVALFATIPLVALMDLLTGADLGFSPLYAAPVALIAWSFGRGAGLVAAIFSGAAWSGAGHLNHPDLPLASAAWNDSVRLGGLVALAVLLSALRRSQDGLRAALAQRDEFLSILAHELRAPVAAIEIVATRLARTAGIAPEPRRALEQLLQESRDLRGLAEDVLSMARLEAGIENVEAELFDIRELVGELAERSDRISVVESELTPVHVRADRQQMRRALANILDNALKFSGEDDTVRIALRQTAARAEIEVADSGIGLAPGEAALLFAKYRRSDDALVRRKPGVGLGLYLSRLIVVANGGSIEATSPGKGQGTTVRMCIPVQHVIEVGRVPNARSDA